MLFVNVTLILLFTIALVTGGLLEFVYAPDGYVVYNGSYEPLRSVPMDPAYEAELRIRFDTTGGALVPDLHQLSSLLFMAALLLRMILAPTLSQRFLWFAPLATTVLAMAAGFLVPYPAIGEMPVYGPYSVHLLLVLAVPVLMAFAWWRSRTSTVPAAEASGG
ncbi:hypothetical protein [Spongiactinospora sp. TRM90649]|uniref:hypothetical protein n=1 Tax=Spongiactinospora sp. TRM90649 TaxID=3031114 RepID=UPI0023F848C5|nr:hypothetical protein [Spongiactinospora sp. TRM90649]MDF5758974.1 hypothetical protein [Spongiactinospora sp. TRM90649]